MSSTEINVFFENPGLDHVGETILSFLDFQSLLACRFVCSSWKGMTQNSRFWVETKKVLQYLPPKQQREWKKLISFSKVYLTFVFVCNVYISTIDVEQKILPQNKINLDFHISG